MVFGTLNLLSKHVMRLWQDSKALSRAESLVGTLRRNSVESIHSSLVPAERDASAHGIGDPMN